MFATALGVLFSCASSGQLLYVNEWLPGIGATNCEIVRMDNGDLIASSILYQTGQVQTVRMWKFSGTGDPLWTQDIGTNTSSGRLLRLPGDRVFLCYGEGSAMLDGSGEVLFEATGSNDACVLSGGRLLLARRSGSFANFVLIDTLGATLGASQFAVPPGNGGLLVAPIGNGHVMAFTEQTHDDCTYGRSQLLLELDSAGQLVDSLSLQDACDEFMINTAFGDIVALADGGFLGVAMFGSCSTSLVRGNSDGDTLWTRYYGGFDDVLGYECFNGGDCIELPNGNLLISGGGSVPLAGYPEACFVETDAEGTPLCAASFTLDPTWLTEVNSVVLLPEDRFAFLGRMWDAGGANISLLQGAGQDACLISMGVDRHAPQTLAKLFPNPVDRPTLLSSSPPLCAPAYYSVTDASGNVCQSGVLYPADQLDPSALSAGAYTVRLTDADGTRITARFVVR